MNIAISIGSTPFGLSRLCTHCDATHIGTTQYATHQNDKQTQVITQEWDLFQAEIAYTSYRHKSQDCCRPPIHKYKRPARKHLREAKHITIIDSRRNLSYQAHQKSHYNNCNKRWYRRIKRHCPTNKIYSLAQCV